MPKPREDVDWYVQMSERMERREGRRKWIVLGVVVLLPLLLMVGFILYIKLDNMGYLKRPSWLGGGLPAQKPVKEPPVAPQSVTEFHQGNISFAQLDAEGMVTSITHTFRELLPEGAKVFTVVRDDDTHGKVLLYRLRNIGTGETYEFSDVAVSKVATGWALTKDGRTVEVSKVGMGWALTEDGWTKVRDTLQARMSLKLGRPTLSGG